MNACSSLLVALAMGAPSTAPSDFGWRAPAGCPGRDEVWGRIEQLLAPGHEPPTSLEVRGDVSMSTQGFRLSLALRHDDVDDVRTLESTSCMRLAEAAALIVAVSLDPVAVTEAVGVQAHSEPEPSDEPRVPETPPTPLPPPTARVPPPERVSPSPSTERADRPGLGLRADVGVGGGVLPSAGVGLSFTVSLLGRRHWRVEAHGAYWVPRDVGLEGLPDAGGRLWAAQGGTRGCGVPAVGRLEFPLCAGVDVGAIGGRGRGGGIVERRSVDVWLAAATSAGLAWAFSPTFALSARAELLVPLRRPGFHLDQLGPVHQVAPVAGRGWLGFEVRFF